jgi:hypothetical protein
MFAFPLRVHGGRLFEEVASGYAEDESGAAIDSELESNPEFTLE